MPDLNNATGQVDDLLAREVSDESQASQWLADIWNYFLETGLYFAGGPAGEDALNRLRLVEHAQRLASDINRVPVTAEAHRITGHVMNAAERYPDAVGYYQKAIPALESVGRTEDAMRTRLGFTAALMMSGQYSEALEVIQQADNWFVAQGDTNAHARALINKSNIWHRLDAHQAALEGQLEAADIFSRQDHQHELAAVTINIANSLSYLVRFQESDDYYLRAEEIATSAKLTSVVDQARYNRAYLQFLRGRYSDSILAFNRMRKEFQASGSTRHAALCDLDQAEIYLHLNLGEDAASLARRAQTVFSSIDMAYEEAKATVFEAVGRTLNLNYQEALDLFESAERKFMKEDNSFWLGMIELYRAGVLLAMGRLWEAKFQAESAAMRFSPMGVPYQEGMALVVLGRVALMSKDLVSLEEYTTRLIAKIETTDAPLLDFPAYMLCAESAELQGDNLEAKRFYEKAAGTLDDHRNFLHHDELRVRYLEGKDKVFESLVSLELADEASPTENAFRWCEQAKARALAELLGQHLPVVKSEVNTELLGHINHLREVLNSQYTRARPDNDDQHASTFDIDSTEKALEHNLQQLAKVDENFGTLLAIGGTPVAELQASLPKDTTLACYFTVNGEVLVFLLDRKKLSVFRQLTSTYQVQNSKQSLDFQMKKFSLGDHYIDHHMDDMTAGANRHLASLYDQLVRPWIQEVQTGRLAIVPHGPLHGIPFHALLDQTKSRYLIDTHQVFYAPSAEILRLVSLREPAMADKPGLIIGNADELAPGIEDEVHSLHELMPACTLLSGQGATADELFRLAPSAGYVHIACHAVFRQDNPMFSSFEMNDRAVTALDLYGQSWPCEFVTLSGCSSGVSRIFAGDELMGLARGLFHAGAHSLVVSQWNVSDRPTMVLMQQFYLNWLASKDKVAALTASMQTVRSSYPHPFYWAPFVLMGTP